jgi:hypothetical protein
MLADPTSSTSRTASRGSTAAVDLDVPVRGPRRRWVMSRWSAVPRCPSDFVLAYVAGSSPRPYGYLFLAVPASFRQSREQAVSRLG